jgi:hypothetical protein
MAGIRSGGKFERPEPGENGIVGSRRKRGVFMRMSLKHCVWVLAVAVGVGVGGSAAQAAGAPFDDHDQDYSKNKTYQKSMREGRDDHAHARDHSRKRNFKKDEDRKAYEAGYQKGHGN